MAGAANPLEPTYAASLVFDTGLYTGRLGLIKIVGDHQKDFLNLSTQTQTTYTTNNPGGGATAYQYNPSTATFSAWAAGAKYYQVTIGSLNKHSTTITDVRNVISKLRTVELVVPDGEMYDLGHVVLRMGIARQMLDIGPTETYGNAKIYAGSYNVSEQEISGASQIKAHEYPEDYNGGTVTQARVGGIRTYVMLGVPLATDIQTGASFEIEMTNEGRIFDYRFLAKQSNRVV